MACPQNKSYRCIFNINSKQDTKYHYNSNNNKQTQNSRPPTYLQQTIKKMDIQYNPHHLSTLFNNLLISTPQNKQNKRISNTLTAVQMQSELNPNHIDQYNVLYLNRLKILGCRFDFKKIHKIQEVQEILGVVHVIGIFKRVEGKRVRAFQKGFDQYYRDIRVVYDEKDGLELQDASGKLKFTLTSSTTMNNKPIKPTDLPYGIIVGLTGKNNDQKMQFIVDKITLPNLAPQRSINLQDNEKTDKNGGINIKKTLFMSATTIQQLDYVLAQLFKQEQEMCFLQDVHAVVVMGFTDKLNASQYKKLDQILLYYAKLIDIHIMPNDKLGQIYPQKPLHPILLPNSYKKISLVNNPQIFHTNPNSPSVTPPESQASILVCSGQNIRDLIKNSSFSQNSLDSMQQLLQYSHIAPTCPFSLKCQMMDQDHLIIHEMPHVFIAGNCDQDTKFREWEECGRKVLLVAIGKGQNVLLDENLNAVRIDFVSAGASLL